MIDPMTTIDPSAFIKEVADDTDFTGVVSWSTPDAQTIVASGFADLSTSPVAHPTVAPTSPSPIPNRL